MKVKTSELAGASLDWAVAKCEGHNVAVLTLAEQRARWLEYLTPERMAQEAADYDKHLAPTAKPKLTVLGDDGYKRSPTHQEARMLFGAGIPTFQYSTSWAQGGPIIEREKISLQSPDEVCPNLWAAKYGELFAFGPTPLIAAMRCFVLKELGKEVDIPEELLK